jgi:hypothetical protein
LESKYFIDGDSCARSGESERLAIGRFGKEKSAEPDNASSLALDALRKKIQDTEAQRDKANLQLGSMISDLQIEATM